MLPPKPAARSEEHTSELQSHSDLHSFPTRALPIYAIPTNGVPRDAVPADRIPRHAVPADRVPGHAVPADRRLASLSQVGETDEAVWHQPAIRRADAASEARCEIGRAHV